MKLCTLIICFLCFALHANEPTFTVDAKTLDYDGNTQHLKAQDVVITFKNGAKLISRHAELDFDSIHGVMSSGEGDELVIFSGFLSDDHDELRPIIVKGKIMMVGIEEDMIEVTSEKDVEILFDEDYTAYGDRAVFRNERKEDLSSLSQSGLVTLESEKGESLCRIEHKNGDLIEALRINFRPQENQVDAWEVKGSIASLAKLREVGITSDHVQWKPQNNELIFLGKTVITDDEVGSLTTVGTLEVLRENNADNAPIRQLVASGEFRFDHLNGEQSLGGFGKTILSIPDNKLVITSPKSENGLVTPSQQAFFYDSLGKIFANQFVIEYEMQNGEINPTFIFVKGRVRLQNQLIPDPNIQKMLEQYAIADLVKYSPITKQMTLSAYKGKRVLYYDKTKGIQVSAPGLYVTRGANHEWEVQGKGNVRMKFTQHEIAELQEFFPFLR